MSPMDAKQPCGMLLGLTLDRMTQQVGMHACEVDANCWEASRACPAGVLAMRKAVSAAEECMRSSLACSSESAPETAAGVASGA